MTFTHNIILVLFFCVTNTWTHSLVDFESNNLNASDHEVKLSDDNDGYLKLDKIIIDHDGTVDVKCQHGPKECYGNKLHACAIDKLRHATALIYNICLMNSTSSVGSDDESADRCGKLMYIDSEPIKECAKGARGMELLVHYGIESWKAHFSYVPYVLINGKVLNDDHLKKAVCAAFTNPPPPCTKS